MSPLAGCDRKTPDVQPTAASPKPEPKPVPQDDPESIAALKEIGALVSENSAGLVTQLSLATDEEIVEVLPHLAGLPNL